MNKLEGKRIYGFGDSLVAGHYRMVGMLDHLAKKNHMTYIKYAVNGATVIPDIAKQLPHTDLVPHIALQIERASDEMPDFICFDGMTNDAYPLIIENYLGEITEGFREEYDTTTFAGAFENVCCQLRMKYKESVILYICPHKMPTRDKRVQELLQSMVVKICKKWSFPYLDMYHEGCINTCFDPMREAYSYNEKNQMNGGNGTYLNEEGYERFYTPQIEAKLLNYC